MRFIRGVQQMGEEDMQEDDPIAGVAQLFDVSVAFIVAVITALFTLLSTKDLLNKDSEWTIVRKSANGEMEIVEKKKDQVISHKVSATNLSGNGVRLGTAYQLDNGQIVYVADTTKQQK